MNFVADRLSKIKPSMTVGINVKAKALKDEGKDVDDIDLMIDEDQEEVYTFNSYDEASAYLMCHGIRELSSGFPFNIKIERLQ